MSTSCVYSATVEGANGRRRKHGGDRPNAKSQRLTSPSQSSSAGRARNSMSPPEAAPLSHPGNFQNEDFGDPAIDDSSLRTFEEDFVMSDQMLYGFVPEVGSQSSEGFVRSSKSPGQMGLDRNSRCTSGPMATETTTTGDSPGFLLHPGVLPNFPVTNISFLLARMNPQSSVMTKSDVSASHSHFTPSRLTSTQLEILPPEQPAYRDSGNVYPSPKTPTRQTDQKIGTMTPSTDLPASCRCLQTVISFLEELEEESDLIDLSGLDSVLAFHKEALAQCRILLRCVACMARSEYPLLIVLVCEKLVSFCEKMVNEYLRRPRGQFEFSAEKNSLGDSSVGRTHHQQKFSVGKYEVNLPVELDCILRLLVALQLKALEGLLIEVRKTVSLSLHGARVSKFLNTERRLKALAEKLQQPEAQAMQHRASPG